MLNRSAWCLPAGPYGDFVSAMVYGDVAAFEAAITTVQALVKEAWP